MKVYRCVAVLGSYVSIKVSLFVHKVIDTDRILFNCSRRRGPRTLTQWTQELARGGICMTADRWWAYGPTRGWHQDSASYSLHRARQCYSGDAHELSNGIASRRQDNNSRFVWRYLDQPMEEENSKVWTLEPLHTVGPTWTCTYVHLWISTCMDYLVVTM